MKLKNFTIGGNLLENASFAVIYKNGEWDVIDMDDILNNWKEYSEYYIRAINIKNNKAIIKLVQ